mmetsp:Transcript_15158/g.18460  ORF Transcript_15158/g.18460 Transcript_15158/m.18460 type:complete len:150 (-) Transcript_15158:205-654(-)
MSSSYVQMGNGQGVKPGTNTVPGLDDPNLSPEEKDLRLAIALQQQENAAAYDAHKKRHDAANSAKSLQTTRSNAGTRLAAVRKNQKESDQNGDDKIDGSYGGPGGNSSDFKLALDLHKVGQTTAGTANIVAQDGVKDTKENIRTGRSGY